jgi:thermostable 8-oxoguanine DNA glycosylase
MMNNVFTQAIARGKEVVDPYDTDYSDRGRRDMEVWLLFCIAVAGKNSKNTTKALGRFTAYTEIWSEYPLYAIKEMLERMGDEVLDRYLRAARFGQYTKLHRAFSETAREFWCRDLRTLTIEELESIHGIGPKTSRYFKLTTDREARVAALDTHILKWLKKLGYPDIPKSTPSGRNYARIEQYFLQEVDKRGMTINDLDIAVWTAYNKGGEYDD